MNLMSLHSFAIVYKTLPCLNHFINFVNAIIPCFLLRLIEISIVYSSWMVVELV